MSLHNLESASAGATEGNDMSLPHTKNSMRFVVGGSVGLTLNHQIQQGFVGGVGLIGSVCQVCGAGLPDGSHSCLVQRPSLPP